MTITTWTELILILSAVGGGIAWLIKFHSDRRREGRDLGKIGVDTIEKMGGQIDRLENKVIKLREDNDSLQSRVEALEALLHTKEVAIKQKDADIVLLQTQVSSLNTRLNKVLIYVSGLLRELNERGIQYTPPEPGVLDTDPNIQAIKGKK